jgi:hypothetical protein
MTQQVQELGAASGTEGNGLSPRNFRRWQIMTVEEYWQAVTRYWSGNLSTEEAKHYQIAGVLAECAARERGSTLLPHSMQQPDVLPQRLEPETLLVLGLTALVLAD